MPKIIESDDEGDSTNTNVGNQAPTVDVAAPAPQRAAHAHIPIQTNNPSLGINQPAVAAAPTFVQAPKRRVLEEDDDFPAHAPQTATTPATLASQGATGTFTTNTQAKTTTVSNTHSDDFIVLSDDESMEPPTAKRPKLRALPAPTAKSTATSKSTKKKAEKRYYSDDDGDSDFDDANDELSPSEDEEDNFIDVDDSDEDYGGRPTAKKERGGKKSAAANREPVDDEAPAPKKRGRPLGSKSKPSSAKKSATKGNTKSPASAKGTKKRGRPSAGHIDDISDLEDEYDDEEEGDYSLGSEEEDGMGEEEEDDFVDLEGDDGEERRSSASHSTAQGDSANKKLTARQKAMSGEETEGLMALTGERSQPAAVVEAPAQPRVTMGRKAALHTKKAERTQPPDDVMQEVTQVVNQLLNRNPAYDKMDARKRVVPDMYFNPELRKDTSNPTGNFITLPLAIYSDVFSPRHGWSEKPLRANETADIPEISLKRGLRDTA